MNIKSVFVAMFAIMIIASGCNDENPVNPGDGGNKDFYIKIGSKPQSRAEGNNSDQTPVDFTTGILVFTASDVINKVVTIKNSPGTGEVSVDNLEDGAVISDVDALTDHCYLYGNTTVVNTQVGKNISDVHALSWNLTDLQDVDNGVEKCLCTDMEMWLQGRLI